MKRQEAAPGRMPVAVDLFSGAGGLTVGLKRAGYRVLGAVEIDPSAVRSFRLNHPEVHVWEQDIRTLSDAALREGLGLAVEGIDLVAGCPPCQGFSNLRTKNRGSSVADARNDLVYEFCRLVETLKPRAVLLENVPGLRGDARFREVCDRLSRAGYLFEHRIVDAADLGVPQRRRRLVLVATQSGPPRFPALSPERVTVRMTIGSLPQAGSSGDPLHDLPERRSARVAALIARVPKDGGSRKQIPEELLLPCHRRHDGHGDVFGRMAWDRVSPTITSGCHNPSRGRFVHPEANRAITLREAALLQTFPPDYLFCLRRGKEEAARQIGNALPPEMIRRIALSLRA